MSKNRPWSLVHTRAELHSKQEAYEHAHALSHENLIFPILQQSI